MRSKGYENTGDDERPNKDLFIVARSREDLYVICLAWLDRICWLMPELRR